MAKLNGYTFDTWDGTLQAPTGRGPQPSTIRTSKAVDDFPTAYALAYTYSSLISPYAGYAAELPGGFEALPVRVAGVTVVSAKVFKGQCWLIADWRLVWG